MRYWSLPFFFAFFLSQASLAGINNELLESYKFLKFDKDQRGLTQWARLVEEEHFWRAPLVMQLIEYQLEQKDRKLLQALLEKLYKLNACPKPAKSAKLCQSIQGAWQEALLKMPFYESSAGELSEARALVIQEDCRGALGILERLESKEGTLLEILEIKQSVFECLEDKSSLSAVKRQIQELVLSR